MKANEYFKKHGYKKCKAACAQNGWLNTGFWIQLKRLVESHELVMEFGDDASYLKEHLLRNPTIKEFYLDDWCRTFSVVRLKQAILDVESCQ